MDDPNKLERVRIWLTSAGSATYVLRRLLVEGNRRVVSWMRPVDGRTDEAPTADARSARKARLHRVEPADVPDEGAPPDDEQEPDRIWLFVEGGVLYVLHERLTEGTRWIASQISKLFAGDADDSPTEIISLESIYGPEPLTVGIGEVTEEIKSDDEPGPDIPYIGESE